MAAVFATLPLQVMCQFVIPGDPSYENTCIAMNISTPVIKPETLPFGYIAYPEMNAAYKFHGVFTSWWTARKLCVAEGAQLAVIDTPEKLNFIDDQRPAKHYLVHVGIHSFFEMNDWVSVKDGAPVSTPQWADEYPQGSHRCASLTANGSGLANFDCRVHGYYMCELPIPKS